MLPDAVLLIYYNRLQFFAAIDMKFLCFYAKIGLNTGSSDYPPAN